MSSPMLNTAMKAARAACTILNRAVDNLSALEVHKKGHSDFVSEVDVACERTIVEILREAYPRHQILGEENGLTGPEKSEFQWIIDPVDGTTNFLHGFPQYAVSIALKREGEIIEAVVADPVKNEIFTATRGVGAFLNGRRIRVSKRTALADSLVGMGFPFRKDSNPEKDNPLRMTNEPLTDLAPCYTLEADGTVRRSETPIFGEDDYVVNLGPQHPSTHGVLHFRIKLEGETIKKVDPILGYIHRGVEKLNESLTYPQTLALTDRLDYLGAMQNRHALCMCIEQAMGVEVSERVQYIRTIMDELQRIDSHILFFSCLCQDLGATTAFLYGFRDREKILDIFEETCGGRLILNYNTIGGVMADIHPNFVKRVKEFIPYMRHNIQEYFDVFINNVIFRNRAEGVGVLSKEQVISFGCTGGTGRASGWHNDVRKRMPYAMYGKVDFKEITRTEGDSFARCMIRMDEILESLNIIEQLIDNIPEGPFQEKMKPIIKVPEGTYYSAVEGSRGEFGVLLESRGDKFPYRLHYRSTGLPLVAVMDTACSGNMIADLITIGGTVDYVVPDIDR